MSKPSAIFLRGVHQSIDMSAKWAMGALGKAPYDDDHYGTIREELAVLRGIRLKQAQANALEKLMIELGRSVAFDLLSMIDGVVYSEGEELPDMALIDRATGQDIADGFLHDEFHAFAPDE